MREKILRHIKVIRSMEQAQIPYTFIGKFEEGSCYLVSQKIVNDGLSNLIGGLCEKAKQYLMTDPDILATLKQIFTFLTDDQMNDLNDLLCQVTEKKLSAFEAEDIKEILMEDELPANVQYPYLLYFKQMDLSREERLQVFQALEKYRARISIRLADLTKEERMVLLNPLFLSDFLNDLLNDRRTWEILTHPYVLELLQKIDTESAGTLRLTSTALCQIEEQPEQLMTLFERVINSFSNELKPEFLKLWIWNGSLLTDLKRLSWQLPSMTEDQKKEILGSKISYVGTLYKTDLTNLKLTDLGYQKQQILLYAMVAGKKHFLSLVNEHSETFQSLPRTSFLLDPDIYQQYLNLNTVNEKNLQEAVWIDSSIKNDYKKYLKRKSYTFEELKRLSALETPYVQLYECLTNDKSDERLHILKELVNCHGLHKCEKEDELKGLAEKLSQKPLSVWKHTNFVHIRDLKGELCIQLLKDWECYRKFVPEIKNEQQVIYLIRNRNRLDSYDTFAEFQKNMLKEDVAWKWLKEHLSITEEFEKQYETRIRQFVSKGEAEIMYQFCMGAENKKEEVRRLLTAELMGKFQELKYHEKDLEREIAYPISKEMEDLWKVNLKRAMGESRIWEEDRLLPVMQIGEIPKHTCISYQNGVYKNCLLSCFDSNKKVLYATVKGKTVFRALIRLTKGAWESQPMQKKKIEFADLTQECKDKGAGEEELVLFLERPYVSGISAKEEEQVVSLALQLIQEKARTLQAGIVISQSYRKYETFKDFESRDYYIYISASKNGSQYLDSLCGEATVSASGMYGKNRFLFEPETNHK